MGFRVGIQCFLSQSDAEDFYFSQQAIIPINKADAVSYGIFQKYNGEWYQYIYRDDAHVGSYKTSMVFAECDPAKNVQDGMMLGGYIAICFVVAFGIKAVLNMIWRA